MTDPAEDDVLLTGFLDGELPAEQRESMTRRLASEPQLRARLEELRRGEAALQAAFSATLGEAPRTNLRAKLAPAAKTRRPRALGPSWRLAAAVAVIAFLVGAAASRIFLPANAPPEETWRQSVAEYMELYNAASFAPMGEPVLGRVLSALSDLVGVDLSAASLRSGDIAPNVGVTLQYQGAPLVEVGYVIDGEPAAFCVIRNGEPDAAPSQVRLRGFNAVTWAKSGRGFIVISAAPADRVEQLARALNAQVAIR